ncbi:MAG TPA: ATP-binding protein, partial [Ottowia sp.]|nr:ATP-binding protein [Ottowia sp.]
MPRLIFFCGHAGTGKTTLAKRALPLLHQRSGES